MSEWQPIETAPKDGTRVLLFFKTPIFTGINIIIGRWNGDVYAKKQRPYFTHDLERIAGTRETRSNQPTQWMPLPQPPERT